MSKHSDQPLTELCIKELEKALEPVTSDLRVLDEKRHLAMEEYAKVRTRFAAEFEAKHKCRIDVHVETPDNNGWTNGVKSLGGVSTRERVSKILVHKLESPISPEKK